MSILDGSENYKHREDLPYLREKLGDYVMKVEELADFETQTSGIPTFLIKAEVVASKGEEAFPPGSRVVHIIQKDMKYGKYHLKDITNFAMALLPGVNPKTALSKVAEIVSTQAAAGELFGVSVQKNTEPNKKGEVKDVNLVNFLPAAQVNAA